MGTASRGTKIVSPRAELAALRGLCHKDPSIVGTILKGVDASYFHHEEAIEIYDYIKKSITEHGKAPKYRILIEDPAISKEARSYIRDSEATIQSVSDARQAVKVLSRYRKRRGLHNIAHRISAELQKSKFDEDALIDAVASAVSTTRLTKTNDDDFLHFGKNNNSSDFVKDLIFEKPDEDMIPSGLASYDEVNGGFFRGSLVTIAGNSGAGKSHVASALAKNMATFGYKVTVVPLEMSKREMTSRIIANVAKVDSLKLLRGTLTKNEQELTWKRYRRWVKRVAEKGGRYSVFKPPSDMTIEEIMASIESFGADVNIIDYISLLAGVDGDDQWKQLGAVARYAKIHAENHNCVNILLAQLSDDGKIKYSRAITEHSSNSWIFQATQDTKEQGILKIEQPKSRNQVAFPFTIKIDYSTSTISDLGSDDSMGATSSKEKEIPNLATEADV